ncbi:Noggin-3 [Fasciola hepatica]|uniref:Noggin-3 n=1 Tax=Fasciola hepatica TaxID=6192 RepID=A0A4E0RS04_FASHE|nr:Noggin-3 [Fasciola hepatica]
MRVFQGFHEGYILVLFSFFFGYRTIAVVGTHAKQQLAMITTGNRLNPSRVGANADYSRKVTVRVSDVLTRQRAAAMAAAAAAAGMSSSTLGRPSSNFTRSRSNYPADSPYEGHQSDSNTPSFTRPLLTGPVKLLDNSVVNHPGSNSVTSSPVAQIVVRPSQPGPPVNALVVPAANSRTVINEDRSWPPEHSQEFARVDVRVMGERIDSRALLHLRPSAHPGSVRKLRKILGPDLQSEWMSIDPPPKGREESGKLPRSITMRTDMPKPSKHILNSVNNLNFTVFRPAKGTDVVIPIEFTEEQITLMKEWLLQLATCRMDFMWEDLGPLFWPRWIRRGICVNTVSCSWPPGMRCLPSGSRMLKLLRWVCTNDEQKIRDVRARWRRGPSDSAYTRHRRDQDTDNGARRRFTREERRSRRVRRLIRKLSLSANGYHCEWSRYEYMVSDHCVCGTG